jgi:hypothetical protein
MQAVLTACHTLSLMSHQRLETKLSLYIRRDDEIDVSGNDESA